MKHDEVIEKIYENGNFSFFTRLGIAFHLLGCRQCARDIVRYENARRVMRDDFFTETGPSVADSVMAAIGESKADEVLAAHIPALRIPPEILPIRDWIVTGVIVIAALTTSFFGMDFSSLVQDFGSAFTIPLAITIGTVITVYIAIFIAKHLKELSKLFGLPVRD
jgi:hypothetical protein